MTSGRGFGDQGPRRHGRQQEVSGHEAKSRTAEELPKWKESSAMA